MIAPKIVKVIEGLSTYKTAVLLQINLVWQGFETFLSSPFEKKFYMKIHVEAFCFKKKKIKNHCESDSVSI